MVKIRFNGLDCDLSYNEFGNMFAAEYRGEIVEYLCYRRPPFPPGHNQCWLYSNLLTQFELRGIVDQGLAGERPSCETHDNIGGARLVDIIHPEFHDEGYSGFGDFSRGRLGQQCQYGSRYITGRLEGYPALGEGLRFKNLDSGDYHSIRIHRDDMDEFERRYRAYQEERLAR